ncbi:AAA family ATPase [Beduini massiliensis]|uniref:AAA family ATPase n=1 Tax=Beduini massiliensis TaxID=1585974 RepID=UPI00059AB0F4|nr:AAA family ATPase [Beduini massiliensis]
MTRIYIIGTVGSGKSTFAHRLSMRYSIPHFELDDVVYNGNYKRTQKERDQLFNEILSKKDWVIEDVGRPCFQSGLQQADTIIYLNISPHILKKRIIKRYFKQKFGLEKANYTPTWAMLKQMLRWCQQDLDKREMLMKQLQSHSAEFISLDEHQLKHFTL